jgi:nucleotide-binding universal stress UspA family protein
MKLPEARIASCGDISCEFLIDPIPRPRPAPFTVTLRPAVPRVVFIDNGKPNSMEILRAAQRILRDRGVEVKEQIEVKPSPNEPMPESMLDRLAEEDGLLLAGVND